MWLALRIERHELLSAMHVWKYGVLIMLSRSHLLVSCGVLGLTYAARPLRAALGLPNPDEVTARRLVAGPLNVSCASSTEAGNSMSARVYAGENGAAERPPPGPFRWPYNGRLAA